jgi:type IV secretory pathway TraG/TraD family ATPase VirD4
MSAPTKRSNTLNMDPGAVVLGGVPLVGAVVCGGAWLALRVDDVVHAGSATRGRGPLAVVSGLANGEIAWSTTATIAAAAVVVIAVAVVVAVVAGYRKIVPAPLPIDRAAAHMGRGQQINALREKHVRATAQRLGCPEPFGIKIGNTVLGGAGMYAGWEDVSIDIWGPRSGKTTSRAIPAIVGAPGAVLATSNKRDLVDATRDVRAAKSGEEVWVFDPQGLVDEPPTWWWNPLTFVTDEVSATRLAKVFIDATREPGARTDAYFDGAARDLLAGMLLAAARGGKPITQVFLWLSDATDDEPQLLLESAGHKLMAASVGEVLALPDRQRAGVYGSAKQIVSFLINEQATRWATPGAGRREFDPHAFVRSSGTLYSLSKEGVGTAGPLVLALNVAVMAAAEAYAKHLRDGRLATPLVVVLDEAANVCRWQELPDMYSHFGSRGMIVLTFLQNWDQGVAVWGREGMNKLWNASTVRTYGGGTADPEFLERLSQLIGEFERTTRSVSSSRHGGSTSLQSTRERILDVSDLSAMPRGRVVVVAAGSRPVLVKPVPWMAGPHREAIEASWKRHNPSGLQEMAQTWTAGSAPDRVVA